jgi:hypothetical protein
VKPRPSLALTSVNLRGRTLECRTLDELIGGVRSSSQVLVLRGEAGVGKSALRRPNWRHLRIEQQAGAAWPLPPRSSSERWPSPLVPRCALRGARAIAAAHTKRDAATPEAAYDLLAIADLAPLSELQRAQVVRMRAQLQLMRCRAGAPGRTANRRGRDVVAQCRKGTRWPRWRHRPDMQTSLTWTYGT